MKINDNDELRNKSGSVTVFVLMIATSLIWLITFFISLSETEMVRAGSYELGYLWCDSILGEYDIPLYERYGLMAFYGDEGLVGNKLQYYMDYTFGHKGYANTAVDNVFLYDYSLAKTDNLLEQIRKESQYSLIEEAKDNFIGEKGGLLIRYDDGSGNESEPRVISNEATIRSLPSYGRTNDGLLDKAGEFIKSFTSIKDIVKTGTDEFLVNKYIQKKFRNTYYVGENNDGFFYSEQEYIISGKNSDEQNRKSVRNRIIAMREVMNALYIENTPALKEAILAAGATVTLGYAPEEAAATITAAWALAESINDYELLIRGRPVPVMKDENTWAVSLDNVIDNIRTGVIDTGNNEGDTYNDYIVYLLCLMDDNTKLLRILDLIQINMKYNYREDFLIEEHYVGLQYRMKVNGETYDFQSEY